MGLRAASVRHPDAVVMAPALTEAGQSQNFTIPPSSPINSVSRNGGYVSHDDDTHSCKRTNLKSKCLYADGLFETNECVNERAPLPTSINAEKHPSRKAPVASDHHNLQPFPEHNIMNSSPTPMGDQPDTMGLHKTGMDAMASLLKDKNLTSDMEQLLSNLSSVLPSAPDDDAHHVDDLMQVIKHMDADDAEAAAAAVDEDDVAAGTVPDTSDADTIFPIPFDKDLFNEDMMNICEEQLELTAAAKQTRSKELLEKLERRQMKLERNREFLLRRVRKMQARSMGRHVSAEVAGLYENVHRILQRTKELSNMTNTATSAGNAASASTSETAPSTSGAVVPVERLAPIASSTVHNLVRKLEMSTILQANSFARQKQSSRYFGSGSVDHAASTTMRAIAGSTMLTSLPGDTCDELDRVSGMLRAQIGLVERQIDSDATASSSGGESCDEMQTFNNPHQQFLSINKRATWRYANDRAAVASRWTWLQAQISDLEYRIRQHNELHRQIRACKGAVTLDLSPPATTPSPSMHGAVSASPGTVNGYRGQLPGATKSAVVFDELMANGAAVPNTSYMSARTRPLNRGNFRKRKLLQTTGLHTVTKKAARPSNIRCGCAPPVVPCALCTGRMDPTFPRDMPEQLTVPDRIALLDPGYHPVLSFPDDISMSIHLEAIMKLPDWQQKCMRSSMKTLKGIGKSERGDKLAGGIDNRSKKSEHRKKYNRILKNNSPNPISGKVNPRMGRGRRPGVRGGGGGGVSVGRRRLPSGMCVSHLQSLSSESVDEEMEALGIPVSTIKSESLTPSPLSHVHVVPYRRSRVDSYDIDNIVIPYSVAAATRVEKLEYKEILTPKWRVIDNDFPTKYEVKNNGIVRRISQDSDTEDVSEEVIFVRHEKCEHDEKKKFLSYLKLPMSSNRPRANRRTDSRAESSGANTPDPMSPHAAESSEAAGSPLTSPPAYPLSMLTEDTHQSSLRRRTVSQSRWVREQREDMHVSVLEHVETAPFEPRVFPLGEDVYNQMLKSMPEGHALPIDPILHQQHSSLGSDTAGSPFVDSRPDSPASDSTESAVLDEDPNDPEWVGAERARDRTKR